MTTTATRERPILFSGPMVRAILDGHKTQTRRVVKFCKGGPFSEHRHWPTMYRTHDGGWGWCDGDAPIPAMLDRPGKLCPYGQPGDRLWVRETWGLLNTCEGPGGNWVSVGYAATPGATVPGNALLEVELPEDAAKRYFTEFCAEACRANDGEMPEGEGFDVFRWRPSIHMPRWASRITLEVVSVRVERVRDINWVDAVAEGMRDPRMSKTRIDNDNPKSPVAQFRVLWDSINSARGFGWDANPWVWAVEFRVVR